MALSQDECSREIPSVYLLDQQLCCFQRIYGKAVCDQLQDESHLTPTPNGSPKGSKANPTPQTAASTLH